jgi:hypothetical protein
LRSYIEVVGLRPADSYSAQVTEDDARDISGVSRKGIVTLSTNRGPEYAVGRERWTTYERDVLAAALAHGSDVRSPVVGPDFLERGVAGRLINVAGEIYDFIEGVGDDPFEDIPPYRYCWPPTR